MPTSPKQELKDYIRLGDHCSVNCNISVDTRVIYISPPLFAGSINLWNHTTVLALDTAILPPNMQSSNSFHGEFTHKHFAPHN